MKTPASVIVRRCIFLSLFLISAGLLIGAGEGGRLQAASLITGNDAQGSAVLPKAARSKALVLADRDGDRLSDSLQARLDELAPNAPVDVVVTFSGPGNADAARRAVGPFRVKREFKIIKGFAATMTAAQARGLARAAGVFRVEEDFKVSVVLDAANHDFGTAAARSNFGVTGSGVGICVVDTGVDPAHEQLDNGKVIDSIDLANGRFEPYDDHGHGTHVAAIAAGDGVPTATFRGVAPGASIYAAKALDSAGSGYQSDVIAGVEWCADPDRGNVGPGVHIISMSLGSAGSSDGRDGLSQAVDSAVDSGKTAVVAAGNSGAGPASIGSPGAAEKAVTVGAVAEWSAPVGAANHSDGVYLAAFSSRGPTADDRLKPDIVSPGVSVTSARAGTSSGYVTWSGTSMATPFVAGTAALALQHNTYSPSEVKNLLMATASDRGASGPDNDWGAGLLDGYAFVDKATNPGSDPTPTDFPYYSRDSATVPAGGVKEFFIEIGEEDLGVPIAATLTVTSGGKVCLYGAPIYCDLLGGWAWSPDYDAELIKVSSNTTVAASTCPLGSECGVLGRQETLHYMPTTAADAGTYKVRVYQYPDDPGGIQSGTVTLDLSSGPVVTGSGIGNTLPVADAGTDQTVPDTEADGWGGETVQLNGSNSTDSDGSITDYVWSEDGFPIAGGANPSVYFSVGAHTVVLTVTDDAGDSDTDQVVITVEEATASLDTLHVANLVGSAKAKGKSGKWQAFATVTVRDQNDAPVSGVLVSGTWTDVPTGPVSGTTDATGTVTLDTGTLNGGNSATFEVNNLSLDGYLYDNSGVASITVNKP